MGMFDTFLTDLKTTCPHCKEKIQFSEIQSKKFSSTLEYYRTGDVVLSNNNENIKIVEDYDWCDRCRNKVTVYIIIHKGIYLGCSADTNDVEYMVDNFNIYTAYNQLYTKYVRTKQEFDRMKSAVKGLQKIHSRNEMTNFDNWMFFWDTEFFELNILKHLNNINEHFNKN